MDLDDDVIPNLCSMYKDRILDVFVEIVEHCFGLRLVILS